MDGLRHYLKRKQRQVVFQTGFYTVPRGYNKGGIRITDKSPPVTSNSWEHNNKLVINPVAIKGCAKRTRSGKKELEIRKDNKANALTTVKSDSMIFIEAEKSNRKSELNYLGGIISGRDKWLKDGKNLSRNFSQGNRVYGVDGKSVTLNANGGGMGAKTGLYYTHEGIRTLTPRECEILQGIPLDYSSIVSNSQRYKMIGNGFTIPVIMWILSHLELNDTSIAFKNKNQQNLLF
jgi:DNA (cytosine-5)-methyltransferase 3A